MQAILKRRSTPPLLIAGAALAAFLLLSGSKIERLALEWCVRGFANPPFFVEETGKGVWLLRTVNVRPTLDPAHTPPLVSLGEDPDRVFQTSPPSPIDLAVILNNFRRLGADRAAIAAVLAWDAPDPIGLAALDRTLAGFESLVMAAPLGRGPVAGTMPQAFREASVPLTAIHGESGRLPIVNRVPLDHAILGGDNTWAGFQFLENTGGAARFPPLMARWEDRVVFAFPLLATMRELGVTPDELEIRPGEFLRLGTGGPVVPIDTFGRMTATPPSGRGLPAIPAADLIDAADDLFAETPEKPPVLRDDRAGAEAPTRAFSATFPAVMTVIASDAGLAPARAIRRRGAGADLVFLAIFCLPLALAGRMRPFARSVMLSCMAIALLSAQVGAVGAGIWLPGLPAMMAWCVALAISHMKTAA